MCSGSSQCATSVFHFQLIDYHLKCVSWVKSVEVLKCAGGTTTSTACPRNVQQAASHLLGFDQLHCPRARTVPTHTLLTHTLLTSSHTHCPHTLLTHTVHSAHSIFGHRHICTVTDAHWPAGTDPARNCPKEIYDAPWLPPLQSRTTPFLCSALIWNQ